MKSTHYFSSHSDFINSKATKFSSIYASRFKEKYMMYYGERGKACGSKGMTVKKKKKKTKSEVIVNAKVI